MNIKTLALLLAGAVAISTSCGTDADTPTAASTPTTSITPPPPTVAPSSAATPTPPTTTEEQMNMQAESQQQAIETTTNFFNAIESKDLAGASVHLVESSSVILPFSFDGGPAPTLSFVGLDQVTGYFNEVFQRFDQVRFIDRRLTVSPTGDRAIMEAAGDFTLPDGTAYQNRYIFVLSFEAGSITEIREYTNPVTFSLTFGFPPLGPADGS